MISDLKKTKIYINHRENQLQSILEAAEALFIQRGIDNVSMSAIAASAGITRNTIYQYFPDKQEIAWAIFQKLVDGIKNGLADPGLPDGSGFQRLETLMMRLVRNLEAHPEHSRFIVEFNTLYARESSPTHILQIYQQNFQGPDNVFVETARQGIADGSIRADLDPELLVVAMMNLINAVNSRFALLGSLIGGEYGQPVEKISQEIYRVFLLGIQSP